MFRHVVWLIFLFSLTLFPFPTHAHDTPKPNQIAQLGRGTADTLDWHPDGDVMAVGGRAGLWFYDERLTDLAHFDEVGEVLRLAWSPAGNRIATVNRSGTFQVWDVALEPYTLSLHEAWSYTVEDEYPVLQIAWAPEGDRLAIIAGGVAYVLDVTTGDLVIDIPDLNYAVTWHPDGTQIAGTVDLGGEIGEQVRVWDANTGEVINTYAGIDPYLFWSNVEWSPDGSILVGITSVPATLHVWNAVTGELINDVDAFAVEFGAYFNMWWIDDDRLITIARNVSPPGNSFLDIWDTTDWAIEGERISLGDVRGIAEHPNADTWAVLTSDSQIIVRALEQTEPLYVRSIHTQPPQIIAWSSDNRHLATARTLGQTIHVWELTASLEIQERLLNNPFPWLELTELRWSTDGNRLRGILRNSIFTAPGTQVTGFVVEWDAKTGELLDTIHETSGHIAHDGSGSFLPWSVWSADFLRVATVVDENVTVSTVATSDNGRINPNDEITEINLADYPVKLVWSPDSTMLAVITRDQQGETAAWVYDVGTGNLINRLRPSFSTIFYDISWSPDSSMVALVGRRGIAGSDETEYRLDILEVDPSSNEAVHIATVLDTDTTFYHAWHPESHALAVSTSSGVGIYSVEPAPIGVQAMPIVTIPDTHVYALSWSPDSPRLAGSHEDGTIRIWDTAAISE